jgi:hypothetical protein
MKTLQLDEWEIDRILELLNQDSEESRGIAARISEQLERPISNL